MKQLVVILLWAAQYCYGFDFYELKNTVIKKDIRSIEELLPLLPKEYLEHFTLVRKGRGPQETSDLFPRVVLFGNTSRTVFTFNGSDKQNGYYAFESAQFNDQKKEFEYNVITFNKEKKKPEFSEKNPTECLECHGQNPRPIFDSYPKWEGFYGADHDREYSSEYRVFYASMEKHPRYQFLSKKYLWELTGQMKVNVLSQPNNYYGKQISRLNAMRIGEIVLKDSQYKKYKHSLLYAHYCQSDSDLNEKVIDKYMAIIEQKFKDKKWFNNIFKKRIRTKKRLMNDYYMGLAFTPSNIFSIGFNLEEDGNEKNGMSLNIPSFGFYHDGFNVEYELVLSYLLSKDLEYAKTYRKYFENSSIMTISQEKDFQERYDGKASKYLDGILKIKTLRPKSKENFCAKAIELTSRELGLPTN
ncbi:MAG: hypothetical protein H6621_07220 [Halobacteriovoraceae bacterium]|nr:hypothetical protein [Halobacteriovoraceae bacterium]